jgi:hypothetical protein
VPEHSQSLVANTMHKWSFTLPYSADLLFVHMYHTAATIDGWKMVKADQASRLIEISPAVTDTLSDKEACILSIRALYCTDENSEMELVLQTSKLMESKEAFSAYPVDTIIRLNGKGWNKTPADAINSLGSPITKTIAWHLKNRGLKGKLDEMNASELRSTLGELLGPAGADMILGEISRDKDKDSSNTDGKS